MLKRCGGCRRLSGPSQGDAAAKVDEAGGATAVAVAELGQGSSGARKKMKEREVAESPTGRPIYKASS